MREVIGEQVADVALPYVLHLGDCIEVMRALPDNSVDSIVTDPPYELGFMGKSWDASGIAYNVDMWREALRVLKPGGHLLSFSGSRTYHRMAVAIEDAGFEVRDQIMWVYGSGFPKSLDVSKAIDKAGAVDTKAFKEDLRAAVQRSGMTRKAIDDACGFVMRFDTPYEDDPRCWGVSLPSPEKWAVICKVLGLDATRWLELVDRVWRGRAGKEVSVNGSMSGANYERADKGEAVHDAARQWEGWGTALKPAHEPICVARKPLVGTVAANVQTFGTGALNIERCRVEPTGESKERSGEASQERRYTDGGGTNFAATPGIRGGDPAGRWPANLIHDGSAEVVALFPEAAGQQGAVTGREPSTKTKNAFGDFGCRVASEPRRDLDRSAARFFYCAKPSRKDRNDGLPRSDGPAVSHDATMRERENADWAARNGNHHPTVKPTDLMAYLVRLVTPPGGLVLDAFMGSGSTGKACMREGFRFVGIDMMPEYVEIARARIEHERVAVAAAAEAAAIPEPQLDLFAGAA